MSFLLLFSWFLALLSLIQAGIIQRQYTNHGNQYLSSLNATGYLSRQREKRDDPHYVFMHHIVGNTYSYTLNNWKRDIQQIGSGGVDAVALNFGPDSWQNNQLSNAYNAATGTNVKLFLSFDFSVFPCNVDSVVAVINQFAGHASQFRVDGKPLISSFLGQCFGNNGWQQIKDRTDAYLMPFIEGIEGQFGNWKSLDSWFCWGCAWPQGNQDKSTDDDEYYLDQLGSSIKYVTSVSPWMFTHYDYKNFYQRGDDWLIANRWEQLIRLRDRVKMVEMSTWNDFGESNYFGDIEGEQPEGTTWANGFSHLPFFELSKYYITAYKTGSYPSITEDTIYFWARPHPAHATASSDPLARPSGYAFADDNLWVLIFATGNAEVSLTCGTSSQTFDVQSGVNKLKIPLSPGKIKVSMNRNGQIVIDHTASEFTYSSDITLYNYNVYIGSAKASQNTPAPAPSSSSTSTIKSPATTTSKPTTATTTTLHTSTPTSIETWTYNGCYIDSSSRILPDLLIDDDTQTIEKCLNRCKEGGYKFAGLEYGTQCFCANGLKEGSKKVEEESCYMKCGGDSSEICGAGYRINVYSSMSSSTTTTRTTTATTIIRSSTQTQTSTATTPTSSTSPSNYYGCIEEGTTGSRRALTGSSFSRSDMTPELCQSLCSGTGYSFAGLEYGRECYCGNSLSNNGATGSLISSSRCSTQCSGDEGKLCGGEWTLSVYVIPKSPNSGTSQPSIEWNNLGCYVDSSSRLLRGYSESKRGMTLQSCIGVCSSRGFMFAGMEFGMECYCGDKLETSNGSVGGDQCNVTCDGNAAENCGGSWRLSVYSNSEMDMKMSKRHVMKKRKKSQL